MTMQPSPLDSYREEIRNRRIEKIFRETVLSQESFLEQTSFHRGSRPGPGRKLQLWSLVATTIDVLMMVGTSLLFFSGAVYLMNLFSTQAAGYQLIQSLHWSDLFAIGLAVCFSYMILLRSFLGCSLGESACGLRLGTEEDRSSPHYILRVCLRSLVVIGSGLVILPLCSFISGKDVAGRFSGLSLTISKD